MTNTNEDPGKQIERLVAEHIAATWKEAQQAVERALVALRAERALAQKSEAGSG
jgi:hypothetical protein